VYVCGSGDTWSGVMTGLQGFPSTVLGSLLNAEWMLLINASAFEDCKSLRNITIPQSVTSIASRAFKGCASLKSITMPIALKKDLSRFEAEVQGLVHYF